MPQSKDGTPPTPAPTSAGVAARATAPEVHSVSIDVSHLAVPEEIVREELPSEVLEETLPPPALPVTPAEPPVLGPEHELREELPRPLPKAKLLIDIRVLPDEELDSAPEADIPVLGPEHAIDDDIPVLGPEHAIDDDIPVLGPEHAITEDIPVLGPEHEIPDLLASPIEDIPVLGPEHEIHEDIPVLGPEHAITEDIPVLGPEHEILEDPSAPDSESALDGALIEPEPESGEAAIEEPGLEASEEDEPPASEDDTLNYRRIYEARFRDMERDARVAEAHRVDGPQLFALCLDPDPQVIAAIFQNTRAGLDHARMVAHHHKNPVGLEHVVKRADFLRDTQTGRQLLRNNQMTESLMRRVLGLRPMRDVYKVCLDRDIPDRNRASARGVLRQKFSQAASEERANLVISTEARCLALLVGQTFDSRMTQILCGRQYNSTIFIQNLAHFSACPPQLLVHLLKQPFVRRHTALRRLLLQHPNMPTQAKRSM